MSDEVLDLSTLVERRTVRITSKLHRAGKLYELLGEQELSAWDGASLQARLVALSGFDLAKEPSPAQRRAYTKALRDLVAIVAPTIEPKVLEELRDAQLLAIFGVYTGGLGEAVGESGNAPSARTTGASSRGSNGSTAATRKAGSASRSGSSTRT